MMSLSRPLTTLLAAAFVAAAGACAGDADGPLPGSATPVTVVVSVPDRAAAGRSFPATVTARRRASVATRASGTVERVLVDVGDRVRQGQVLATLDGSDVDARVAAARARVDLTTRTHGRLTRLAAAGAAAPAELDAAEAALRAAEAALDDARSQARYATLRAPFDGVVTVRSVDPGDLATPGLSLIEMVGPGARTLEIDLPADLVATVAVGDSAIAQLPGIDHPVPVRISRIAGALDATTHTVRVEADLPGVIGTVPHGTWARVVFGAARDAPGTAWIPADAVIRRGQLRGVFTVEADTVRLRWVRLGRLDGERIELLAGPTGPVVRRPDASLRDGVPVSAVRVEPLGDVGGGA